MVRSAGLPSPDRKPVAVGHATMLHDPEGCQVFFVGRCGNPLETSLGTATDCLAGRRAGNAPPPGRRQ